MTMNTAGEYNRKLRWLKMERSLDTVTGDEQETYTPNGYLWCNVIETNGRYGGEQYGAEERGTDAIIRTRNFPPVSDLDVLQDEQFNTIYQIEGIRRGDFHNGQYELIFDAYRNTTNLDITINDS